MFDDVVAKNQVERMFQSFQKEDVRSNERALCLLLGKEADGIFYPVLRQVHSGDVASCFGKGQQVAAVAASHFQYVHSPFHPFEAGNVRQVICPARQGKLLEV